MFRLLFISFITLRVIACPVFCAVGGDLASAAQVDHVGGCHCGHEQSTPCDDSQLPQGNAPCDNPCSCDIGCVCQVTPELNSRTVSAEFPRRLDLSPLYLESLDISELLANRCEERHPQRFDLQSGRDVRLVYATLLL